MSSAPLNDYLRGFHERLEGVKADVVRLGALVCESVPRGTQALLDDDVEAGQALVDGDDELNWLALDVEERCYTLLALNQPMATDLRALVTAVRLTAELERSGDLMVNVAKAARHMRGTELPPMVRGLVTQMADEAQQLYRLALEAYVDGDDELAASLDERDDVLDAVHRRYIDAVRAATRAGELEVEAAMQLALVGRYYERVGDHAVNIGERVRYMVTAWMPDVERRVRPGTVSPTTAPQRRDDGVVPHLGDRS